MKKQTAGMVACSIVSTILLAGCAAALPPKELVDARASYQRAESGNGAALAPVPVHEAKASLDAAEASFEDDATSDRTRALSYVAERKAKLAESQGNASVWIAAKEQAEKDFASVQARELTSTQDQLQRTQGQLSTTTGALNMTADQLAQEKVRREAAEKRTREAYDKLAMAAALSIKEEPRGTVIVLPGGVMFVTNKADLLPAAQTKLAAVADALKNQEGAKILVEGHTDSQGTEASNLDLGQRRAQSVRDYLVSRGVKAESITAVGIGQGRPIADNKSPEGRANNRRVEVIVQSSEAR